MDDQKDEDEGAITGHDSVVFMSQTLGQNPVEDFTAVKRVNGDEVENGQRNIDRN